jgi:DNA-binding transcriptional MerR regulator
MFSIGEFARLGAVSVRTLRHYDEIGLLRPARVDPDTGYRSYSADQLGQLNRIVALKELGLSLTQVGQLLAGITLDELRGMLVLRRAQLEQEVQAQQSQLRGVEARLSYIEREGAMPADDIVVKKLPAQGVVVITTEAPSFETAKIVAAVNRADEQFTQLRIRDLVCGAGPYIIYYEGESGQDLTVNLALPVTQPPAELPAPARYVVLPEIEEAAVAVRSGPAASIYPFVYHDLARWAQEHHYQAAGRGRDVWVNMVDDIADVSQQVFEIQLPVRRQEDDAADPD